MFGVRVGRNSLLHEFLHILEVACHSFLEVLLSVPDVDLVCHLAGNPVDDDRHSAKTSVLTLAWSSASSTVAVPYFEVHQFDAFGEFL